MLLLNPINPARYHKIQQLYHFIQVSAVQNLANSHTDSMNRTFSLENMETYFRNFVPCVEHRREPITNFCTERVCLKFMCPECVEIHSRTHSSHPIESIKTCIRKSSEQIQKTIKALEQEAGKNNFLKYKSAQQYENQLIRQLEQVRKGLIEDINLYFKQKQAEIKRETSKTHEIKVKIQNLQTELSKALAQLHLLDKNLFINQQCVNTVKKANKIDYENLLDHFKTKIQDVQSQLDVNLRVEMDNAKRDEFRKVLNSLIGIKSKKYKSPGREKLGNTASRARFQYQRQPLELQNNSQRAKYVINTLSADRLFNQAAFKINSDNYFESQPFLHFFQVTKPNLHLLKLQKLRKGEIPKWQTIPLNINFPIPSFSRTIATQNGAIYLIGGTIEQTFQKSKSILQYNTIQNTLQQVGQLNIGRSSQSVVCLKKMIYIVGGMDSNDEIPAKCEMFNTRTNECQFIAACKHPTINSTLCSLGKGTLVKLGGVDGQGNNSDFIEIYNIGADTWTEIDPAIEDIKGQFGLLSCSGWATLNEDQVFIFGGYNQESDNENSKMSYVFEYKKQTNQYFIKYINMKNLPVAQGFWNPQSVAYNGTIYALQNVNGESQTDCLEDKRNLLIFNGKNWSIYTHDS